MADQTIHDARLVEPSSNYVASHAFVNGVSKYPGGSSLTGRQLSSYLFKYTAPADLLESIRDILKKSCEFDETRFAAKAKSLYDALEARRNMDLKGLPNEVKEHQEKWIGKHPSPDVTGKHMSTSALMAHTEILIDSAVSLILLDMEFIREFKTQKAADTRRDAEDLSKKRAAETKDAVDDSNGEQEERGGAPYPNEERKTELVDLLSKLFRDLKRLAKGASAGRFSDQVSPKLKDAAEKAVTSHAGLKAFLDSHLWISGDTRMVDPLALATGIPDETTNLFTEGIGSKDAKDDIGQRDIDTLKSLLEFAKDRLKDVEAVGWTTVLVQQYKSSWTARMTGTPTIQLGDLCKLIVTKYEEIISKASAIHKACADYGNHTEWREANKDAIAAMWFFVAAVVELDLQIEMCLQFSKGVQVDKGIKLEEGKRTNAIWSLSITYSDLDYLQTKTFPDLKARAPTFGRSSVF